MTHKKISARRLSALPGPRRKKPPIREDNRALREMMASEHKWLQSLIQDAHIRHAFWNGSGRAWDPLLVFTDFDQTSGFTETVPNRLPNWVRLTEYMKLQLGSLIAMALGGYSFTVNVHPSLEEKWKAESRPIERMIQKRCRRELETANLSDLAYAYVIEGRSRTGKSRKAIHIHGYFLTEDPVVATRFKVAMERALTKTHLRNHRSAIKIEMIYDKDTGDGRGYGRWVSYLTKNAARWDARIRGRRVFLSRPLTQAAIEFWKLLKTDTIVLN